MRLKNLVAVERSTVDPHSILDPSVVHYSIPAIERSGMPEVVEPSSMDSAKNVVQPGDVLISKLNPRKARVTIVGTHEGYVVVASPEFVALKPLRVDGRFLLYFLSSSHVTSELGSQVTSATRSHQRVEPSSIVNLQVDTLDLDAQRAIADFLDRETAEIDAFIADQERLIELLTERRTATITHAVTKGLDPSVPMRDSGIPWLGEIPARWALSKVGYHFSVVLGKMLDEKKFNEEHESRPYLRAGNLSDGGLDLDDLKQMTFSEEEINKYSLLPGDLLVVEGGSIGTNVLISEPTELLYQKTINRVRGNGEVLPEVLGCWLRSLRDSGYLKEICNGSTIMHFTAEKLRALPLPFPPFVEQEEILVYLTSQTEEIDELIADAKQAIELSKERRAALISAAVTGQIDVRTHA